MTQGLATFMPLDRQEWTDEGIGQILARFVRRAYPSDTAKTVSRRYDLKLSAAENLTKGHASERAIAKAIRAEGWPLLMALGEAMTGESYEDFLRGVADEHERAAERARARRDHLRTLESRAGRVLASLDRSAA
jgi:hypothetical protein